MMLYFNCGKQDTTFRMETADGVHMPAAGRWQEASENAVCAVAQMEQRNFADAWTEAMVAESMQQSYNYLWIALDDDCTVSEADRNVWMPDAEGKTPCGYLLANVLGDETELLRIAVNPECRKKGTGQALIEAYLAFARTAAVRGLLEVRHGNTAAKSLYEKNGYRVLACRKKYYTHPEEDADIYEIVF